MTHAKGYIAIDMTTTQAQLEKDLFPRWKEAHSQIATDPALRTILIKEKSVQLSLDQLPQLDGFTPDGAIGRNGKPISVLYMLKESNSSHDASSTKPDFFWFRYEAENDGTHKITHRIRMIQKIITGNPSLETATFINLNKCGNGPKSSMAKLRNYTSLPTIRKLIAEEIQLLDPAIIICCGANTAQIVSNIIDSTASDRIIPMAHPSCRYSNEKYEREFAVKWVAFCAAQ